MPHECRAGVRPVSGWIFSRLAARPCCPEARVFTGTTCSWWSPSPPVCTARCFRLESLPAHFGWSPRILPWRASECLLSVTRFSDLIIPDLTSDCQEESESKSRIPILSLCFVFYSRFLSHKLLCKKTENRGACPDVRSFCRQARGVARAWVGRRLPHPAPGCSSRWPFSVHECVCHHREVMRWPGQCGTLEAKANMVDDEAQRSCVSSRCSWTVCVYSLEGWEVA